MPDDFQDAAHRQAQQPPLVDRPRPTDPEAARRDAQERGEDVDRLPPARETKKPPSLLTQIGTFALATSPFWLAVLLTKRRRR